MKFSNLDIQEIKNSGAAYIPVNLTSINKDNKVETNLLCVHDDKGELGNGKNVVWEATEANAAIQLLTAHGNMVNDTKSILKTLKEKAINAANDTNTDADRAIIQKEVDQAINQIDENANVTFNGKTLLDGSKNDHVIAPGTYTYLTNESFADGTESTTNLVDLESKTGGKIGIVPGDQILVSYIKDGQTYTNRDDPAAGVLTVADDTMFGEIFQWNPCANDLDIPDYSNTSLIGKDQFGQNVYTIDGRSAISYHATNPGLEGQISGLTICVMDSQGNPKGSTNAIINNFTETIRAQDPSDDNALVFQTGTKANQSVKIGFTDLRATALGLKGVEKSGSSVCLGDLISISSPNVMAKIKEKAQETFVSSYPVEKDYTKHGQKGDFGIIDYEIHDALEVGSDGFSINGTKYDKNTTVAQLAEKGINDKNTVCVLDRTVYANGEIHDATDRTSKPIKLPSYYPTLKLYYDLVKTATSEEAMRKNIVNLINSNLDLAIEKCDASLKTDKTKKNEFMKKEVVKLPELLTFHRNRINSAKSILESLKTKIDVSKNDIDLKNEFDQAIQQIDENAQQTYNGQTLIDGSKEHYIPSPGTVTSMTNESLSSSTKNNTRLTQLTDGDGNSLEIDSTDTITVSYVMDGKTYTGSAQVGTTRLDKIFDATNVGKSDLVVRKPLDDTVGEDEFGQTIKNPSGKVALTVQSQHFGVDGQIAGLTITFQDKYGTAKDKANALFEHLSTTVCAKDPSEDHSISINKSGKEMKVSFSDLTSRGLGFGSLNTSESLFPTMPDYASQKISEDLRSVKAQNANGETKTLDVTNFTYLNLYDKINNEHLVFDNMLFLNASNQSIAVTAGDIIAKMLVIKAIKEKHYMKANASMIDSAIKKCDMALEDNDRYCKEYFAL